MFISGLNDTVSTLLTNLNLSALELVFCCLAVFVAGCVRGFAGFGLSAVAMASMVVFLAPIELIPIFYVLEGAASIAMFRGGLRDVKFGQVIPLSAGSAIGFPLGLLTTALVSVELSKFVAVVLILTLTVLQFSRWMPPFLATLPGRLGVGITAGLSTGIASVGGMVIALYVLASRSEPKQMRATLVMFLFINMFTSIIFLLLYDIMTQTAFLRGVVLTVPTLAGVFVGSLAFNPVLQKFYRRFCLCLLIAICLFSLARLMV